MEHQQQGGEKGHGVDGPELVFQGDIADPVTHGVLLVSDTVLARCHYFLTEMSCRF
jgi:hypothetical protein